MTNVDTNMDTHHDGLNSLPIFHFLLYTAWTTSESPFTGCFVKIAFAMTVNSTNMSHNTIMFLSPTPANLPSTISHLLSKFQSGADRFVIAIPHIPEIILTGLFVKLRTPCCFYNAVTVSRNI